MGGIKLAWYGDDFTGASDTLATLAEAGLKATLFLGVPTPAQLDRAGPLDAVGIAGAARSMAPQAMREALAPVADFFARCGAPVLHYKCCSTFDSAPHLGSIGVAVQVLRAAAANPLVAILGGQPNLGRYCIYAQLFATASPGGAVHRIDRHPTMSRHPATPMHEADLRRHLALQGLADVTSVDLRAYALDDAGFERCTDEALSQRPDAVLFDVAQPSHLPRLGRMLWRRAAASPLLAVGGSTIEQALMAHWGVERQVGWGSLAPASGPVFVLSGSLSPATARQVEAAVSYHRIALDAQRLAEGDEAYRAATVRAAAAAMAEGRHVLAHTSPTAKPATRADAELAPACARLLRELLLLARPRRAGVAGGDTSSHAVQALAPWALDCLGRVADGVALCALRSDEPALDGLELMLKGGQMGGDDLFERLVAGA